MATKDIFPAFCIAVLVLALVLAVILLCFGVPERIVELICLSLEVILALAALAVIILIIIKKIKK
ncbi:MAG: hypothetical protein IKV62_02700 [Bacteroidales bacterium]|nr:hypothetical protein [Bacteroidales bacterium]